MVRGAALLLLGAVSLGCAGWPFWGSRCPSLSESGGYTLLFSVDAPAELDATVAAAQDRVRVAGLRCVAVKASGPDLLVEGSGGDPTEVRDLLTRQGVLWIGVEAPEAASAPLVAQVASGLNPAGPVQLVGGELVAPVVPSGQGNEGVRGTLEAAVGPVGSEEAKPVYQWVDSAPPGEWRVRWLDPRGAVSGEHVEDADAYRSASDRPVVGIHFDAQGTSAFGELTAKHVGDVLLVVLDGTVELAPVLRDPIPEGRATIDLGAGGTEEAAERLAVVLRTPLPSALVVKSETLIGPAGH